MNVSARLGEKMKPKKRISILTKAALFLILVVAVVAIAIVVVSYHFYSRKIDEIYFHKVETTAKLGAASIDPGLLRNLSDHVRTEEFRAVREEAARTGDESLVSEWMSRQESALYDKVQGADERCGL